MTDKGLLAMDLVCPEGHVAGQLIRNIEHQANEIQVPDRAREEWPRGGAVTRPAAETADPDDHAPR
jgi:hypothetical protein